MVALSAIFAELATVDGGRYQVAWLLSWLSANLAYLKDLDYFEQKQRNSERGLGITDPPAPKPPWRPPRAEPPTGGAPSKGGPPQKL